MLMSVFTNACDLYKLYLMQEHFVCAVPLSVLLLDVTFDALLQLLEKRSKEKRWKLGQKIEEQGGVSLGSFVVVPQVESSNLVLVN